MWAPLFAAQEDKKCCSGSRILLRSVLTKPNLLCSACLWYLQVHHDRNERAGENNRSWQAWAELHSWGRAAWSGPATVHSSGLHNLNWTRTTSSLQGMPWPCRLQNNVYIAMTQDMRTGHLAWLVLTHCSKKKKSHFYLHHSWQTFLQPNLW